MQIEPQTPLPAVYQIVDPYDSSRDSYFVRAVVRDSLTGAQIQLLNLVSRGNGRYMSQFNAPADGSGLGRQIDVTISVYTDALYTTKSEKYEEIIEKWYVKAAPISFGYGGGGESGGESLDYKKLRQIVEEELAKRFEGLDIPGPADMSELSNDLKLVLARVMDIEVPEMPPADFSPVLSHISAVEDRIHSRFDDLPEPEDPDYSEVVEAINQIGEELSETVHNKSEELKEAIPSATSQEVERIMAASKKDVQTRHEKTQRALKLIIDDTPEGEKMSEKTPSSFSRFIGS